MLRRIITTALLAGLAGGLFAAAAQSLWIIPLIHEAETYEKSAATDSAIAGGSAQHNEATTERQAGAGKEWAPEGGIERIAYTVVTNILSGVGFALLLVAAIALSRRAVDWRRGLLWGLGGFAVFGIAPALGLPPDPPGVDAGPLEPRQVWWLGTAVATAVGLGLLVFGKQWFAKLAGILALVLPHAIGAPHVDLAGAAAPAELIDAFIVASLVTTGIFWVVLGGLSGFFYRRLD